MKKIMFYCQNLMGMGHLVRSTEIIRSLVKEFQVCLIDGGQIVPDFEIPSAVEMIRLPALKIKNKGLEVVNSSLSLEEVKLLRQNKLLKVFDEFQPDCLITEGFPFSKRKLIHELMPLLEQVQLAGRRTKVVSCVRDIVLTKKYRDLIKVEEKVCNLINQYFDLLLVHSDPKVHRLEENFSRAKELTCKVHYTGYVAQSPPENLPPTLEDVASLRGKEPMILVSIGGGRFGHELIETIIEASPILEKLLPHKFHIFAGPFMPQEKFEQFQKAAVGKNNINFRRYTPNLLAYMEKAALSISLGGYNTTMNVLKTGVNAMILPSNDGNEQKIRAEKLEKLGVIEVIHPSDLQSDRLALKVITCLDKKPVTNTSASYGHLSHFRNSQMTCPFELQGAQKTTQLLKDLLEAKLAPVSEIKALSY